VSAYVIGHIRTGGCRPPDVRLVSLTQDERYCVNHLSLAKVTVFRAVEEAALTIQNELDADYDSFVVLEIVGT
jgi:hypothetical protein